MPHTKAEDSDPLDVLVLTEQPLPVGCLVECRLLGVIEAEQQDKDGKTERNDRLVAIPVRSHDFMPIKTMNDMEKERLDDITHFFEYYNTMKGGQFTVVKLSDSEKACSVVKKHIL